MSVSQIIANYPKYTMIREKQPLESVEEIQEKISRVSSFFENKDINLDDGVKISFKESWVHIRPSNTEPIIRIFAEAQSEKDALELIETVKGI